MTNRKKLNLGYSNFKDIIENNNYFVDKSMFIEEVINAEKAVVLLPRPRRFGKSINLSMLKCYFDKQEPENEKLFTNLKIWQTGEDIKRHCGKYPVIYLSFKDAKATDWKSCYELITNEIVDLYEKHDYLLENNILKKSERVTFEKILSGEASKVKYQRSLKKLSEHLKKYYNERVVILIDEYDTPIQAGYRKFYDEVIPFMRGLLSGAYKDNASLYKGVITGILRVSKENIFTGLNNVIAHTTLDDEFADKFGFTEPEVKQIIKDFDVKVDYSEIKQWYDGYRFGDVENIYNPWSVLNFVVSPKAQFKTFWTHSSSNDIVKERIFERDFDYIKEHFDKLLRGEQIRKRVEEDIIFPDLEIKTKELLWSLLLFTGYLNATPIPEQAETNVRLDDYDLSIPNGEVKKLFRNIIAEWLSAKMEISSSLLFNAANNLVNNNIQQFEKELQSILGDTFSYFDKTKNPENWFHSYLLGLLAILGEKYIIRSNRESGRGRYDILLRPFDTTKNGIIIEIKSIEKQKENEEKNAFYKRINKAITEAEQQIEMNDYDKELIENKIANIIKLPIVFAGKVPYIKRLNKD